MKNVLFVTDKRSFLHGFKGFRCISLVSQSSSVVLIEILEELVTKEGVYIRRENVPLHDILCLVVKGTAHTFLLRKEAVEAWISSAKALNIGKMSVKFLGDAYLAATGPSTVSFLMSTSKSVPASACAPSRQHS